MEARCAATSAVSLFRFLTSLGIEIELEFQQHTLQMHFVGDGCCICMNATTISDLLGLFLCIMHMQHLMPEDGEYVVYICFSVTKFCLSIALLCLTAWP